ncbi:hypothetical protein [Burkholderia ubonensis]|uniref:hypothetical protein n=1 Tax=Burkholderia ubonensis TaxID=101571 RepID=UPI000AA282EE|nr:hypothetical protein [Burkholderia ubonensis]
MKKMLIALAPMALAGCMTWGGFEQNLTSLVGEPLDVAVSKLGYPNGERNVAGHHIYVWSSSSTGIVTMPQTSYGTATAFNSFGSTTAFGSTTTYVPMAVGYNCEIDLEVDMANRIRSYQYNGNIGGCMRYNRRLAQ